MADLTPTLRAHLDALPPVTTPETVEALLSPEPHHEALILEFLERCFWMARDLGLTLDGLEAVTFQDDGQDHGRYLGTNGWTRWARQGTSGMTWEHHVSSF